VRVRSIGGLICGFGDGMQRSQICGGRRPASSGDGVAGERGAELGQVADIPQPDAAVGAADASVGPSGLNATAATAESVRMGSPMGWKLWVSHSRSVLSLVPTASR